MNASYTELVLAGFILLLPFLYESSHVFRYHLKFFLYYLIVILCSTFLMPVFFLKAKDVRNLLLASSFCGWITKVIGIQWILRGKEYLGRDQSFIIVSNHQSSLDILGMFNIWHYMDKCTVVAKKELFYVWPFGLSAWLCGLIYIDRVTPNKAQSVMNKAADDIKAKKTKLWVFPEGTRRNTGEIHPFKKGSFHMAVAAQLPILPVVFSQYYFLDKKEKRFDHGKVIITSLAPISTEGMTANDVEKLMDQTRDLISKTFKESSKETMESAGYIIPTASSDQN